jgi:hypothetical protein
VLGLQRCRLSPDRGPMGVYVAELVINRHRTTLLTS